MSGELRNVEVQVRIPNLEGDGVAEIQTVTVPVTIDPDTGEELLTLEAIEKIETTKARYMGLLLPSEIRQMRMQLRLTQTQMSELLQAGQKSYTRWESGSARPSRMVNVLLRLIYEGKVFVSDLVDQRSQGVNWWKIIECQPLKERPCSKNLERVQTVEWNVASASDYNEYLPVAA